MTSAGDAERQVEALLTLEGYRFTRGRKQVVRRLANATHPLTLEEVRHAAEPELALSSVYRTLHLLERCGAVCRIGLNGDAPRFELGPSLGRRHHHLHCVTCGHVEDVDLADALEGPLMRTLDSIAAQNGFDPIQHRIELTGRCGPCRDQTLGSATRP